MVPHWQGWSHHTLHVNKMHTSNYERLKPSKIIYKHFTPLTPHTHTHTHIGIIGHRRNITVMHGEGGGRAREKRLWSCGILLVEVSIVGCFKNPWVGRTPTASTSTISLTSTALASWPWARQVPRTSFCCRPIQATCSRRSEVWHTLSYSRWSCSLSVDTNKRSCCRCWLSSARSDIRLILAVSVLLSEQESKWMTPATQWKQTSVPALQIHLGGQSCCRNEKVGEWHLLLESERLTLTIIHKGVIQSLLSESKCMTLTTWK